MKRQRIISFLLGMFLLALPGLAAAEEAFEEAQFEETPFAEETFAEETFAEKAFAAEAFIGNSLDAELSTGNEGDAPVGAETEARSILASPIEITETEDMAELWQLRPTDFTAQAKKNNTVVFKWKAAVKKLPKNVKYYVYAEDPATGGMTQVGKATAGKKLTVKNLPGGDYKFRLRAERIDPKTKNETYGVFAVERPTATITSTLWKNKPKIAGMIVGTSIRLTWTVKEPADAYRVTLYKYGTPYYEVVTEPSFTDTHPTAGKNIFSVCAIRYGDGGTEELGTESAKKTVKYTPVEGWQAPPEITEVAQTGDGRVTVRWKVAVNAESYIISGGKKKVTVAAADIAKNRFGEYEYEVETARSGKKTFKVTPAKKNEKGKLVKGKASPGVKLTLAKNASQLAVTNVSAFAGLSSIKVSWENHNPDVSYFVVSLFQGDTDIEPEHIPAWSSKTEYKATFSGLGAGTYGYYVTSVLTDGRRIRAVTRSIDTEKVTKTGKNVTDVTLDKHSLTLQTGETGSLTATVTPSDAGEKGITFLTGDRNIAVVSPEGEVTAKSVGKTTITVVTRDLQFTDVCLVEVIPVKVTGVALNKTSADLSVGETLQLAATVSPANAENQKVF